MRLHFYLRSFLSICLNPWSRAARLTCTSIISTVITICESYFTGNSNTGEHTTRNVSTSTLGPTARISGQRCSFAGVASCPLSEINSPLNLIKVRRSPKPISTRIKIFQTVTGRQQPYTTYHTANSCQYFSISLELWWQTGWDIFIVSIISPIHETSWRLKNRSVQIEFQATVLKCISGLCYTISDTEQPNIR